MKTLVSKYKGALYFYFSWIFDLLAMVFAIICAVAIIYNSIKNEHLSQISELILSLFLMLYAGFDFVLKRNDNLREKRVFKIETNNLVKNINDVILAYHPIDNSALSRIEEKVLRTYFEDWKKHRIIKPFEYQFVDSYLNHTIEALSLDESDKLFLKYRIISSTMTIYFSKLVDEIEKGDFFTNGTAHNKFIKKIYLLGTGFKQENLAEFVLDNQTIQETINYSLKRSNPIMEQLITERKSREKIQFLLTKCYENAYSNIGDLDKELNDDEHRNLVLLFKYDERFSILKRQWHTEIRNQINLRYAKNDEIEQEIKKAVDKLDELLRPQPFSKALSDFSYCIEKIAPKEYFLYTVYPDRFDYDTQGWSVEKFLKEKVLPRAREYLTFFNKQLIKEFPYLKQYQKRTLDANFYIFYFNRKNFDYYADQESIPPAIKRFLIKCILESENAGDHLASQLVYVKQVIEKLTISGLLFTEGFDIQNLIKINEQSILREARRNNLIISNIHEISSIGNNLDIFIKTIYEVIYETPLVRRAGKKYLFANTTALKIVENAKEILGVFETLKTSDLPKP